MKMTNTIKMWYLPMLLGILFMITGVYNFIFFTQGTIILSGIAFIITGVAIITFEFFNYRYILSFIWALLFGILLSIIGYYLLTYTGDSPFFVLSCICVFLSLIFLGLIFDLSKVRNSLSILWKSGVLSIVFSVMSILIDKVFITISLISLGMSTILLSVEFSKINRRKIYKL